MEEKIGEPLFTDDDSWESYVEEYPYPGILESEFGDFMNEQARFPDEKERFVIEIPA